MIYKAVTVRLKFNFRLPGFPAHPRRNQVKDRADALQRVEVLPQESDSLTHPCYF